MKILIIYSTHSGVSKKCCEMLEEKLKGFSSVMTYDIKDAPPAPNGFDVAIIGGSVRMGKLNKALKKYLRTHAEALSAINTALFLCCGFTENFDDYVAMQLPKSVIPSLGIHCFGGELKPQGLKGMDRLAVRLLRNSIINEDFEAPDASRSPLPEIVPENIARLSDSIRSLL